MEIFREDGLEKEISREQCSEVEISIEKWSGVEISKAKDRKSRDILIVEKKENRDFNRKVKRK